MTIRTKVAVVSLVVVGLCGFRGGAWSQQAGKGAD
jgi:hypothetical protein